MIFPPFPNPGDLSNQALAELQWLFNCSDWTWPQWRTGNYEALNELVRWKLVDRDPTGKFMITAAGILLVLQIQHDSGKSTMPTKCAECLGKHNKGE